MKTPFFVSRRTAKDTGLDPDRIRAITLDLDDTLWPIWPTIERAEAALHAWLTEHAPATAAWGATPGVIRSVRNHMGTTRPDLAHDMSALRLESIRLMLQCAGDDTTLAEAAFEVFFAERQRVDLYEDALPALEWLASRFPVVAVSNGNADVHRIGLGAHFRAAFSAREFGVGKPDARIFLAAAEAAGVDASEVLHVGDDPHLDGVGALQAGMQMAWLNREGQAWSHAPLQPHLTVKDLAALCLALGK
ncbi:putative hydrolase of the HAD superfamily [Hydrogenophaga palleronii]|uniref:Hydrolase of the HAD superfamily n=1 Tax=Hydrogenophaga palleronii TaxID=65655 RepID=A0ABU1WGX4_9BURK|nr:HAD-IA family hydrolase [Hydrogenophaga palleronii]MDR7148518.1 putative hydrolase of the HAD superfamily [Hydrogenophaga palleronii]